MDNSNYSNHCELTYLRDLRKICEQIRTGMIAMNNDSIGKGLNKMQDHLRLVDGENAITYVEYVEERKE